MGARTGERGAVLVMFAVMLPIFLGFLGWALDFGNAAVHRRHLQTQADAAALAAAMEFGDLGSCSNDNITQRALQYAGAQEYSGSVAGVSAAKRNEPRQQDSHAVINRIAYYNQPTNLDPTFPSDVTDGEGPCDAAMVDVKTTHQDVPRFMPEIPGLGAFSPTLDFLNAHARVRIQKVARATGLLPVAVPETRVKRARATFINTADGSVLATADLVEGTQTDGMAIWTNTETPASVPINAPHIEVRVTLSGSTSLTCGDPLVSCYDATSSTTGLAHIRGYTAPATASADPRVGDVRLTGGTCADAYFVDEAEDCAVGVTAEITTTDSAIQVYASLDGTDYLMARNGSTFTVDGVTVDAGDAGRQDITFKATAGTCTKNSCRKLPVESGAVQQRVIHGSEETSGPVEMVRISENGVAGANSFAQCDSGCSHDLVVTVGVEGSLQISQPDDPTVALRITGSGSRTQALDCDPVIANLKDELAEGCGPAYEINNGTACPQPSIQNTPEPWECVDVQTGGATNQIPAGLNFRILGDEQPDTCTSPNNWPDLEIGDPRILTVFLVPFGSFATSGGGSVPVSSFASFYVTGWTGQGNGFTNPCSASEGGTDDPPPDSNSGWMVGHFIKYVLPGGGTGSGETCSLTSLDLCVAVLTE